MGFIGKFVKAIAGMALGYAVYYGVTSIMGMANIPNPSLGGIVPTSTVISIAILGGLAFVTRNRENIGTVCAVGFAYQVWMVVFSAIQRYMPTGTGATT